MCQINEKTAETMECKCKQICCKMQNASLQCAIDGLKNNQSSSDTILSTLESTCNLLKVYSCLPGTCLLERVQWVLDNVKSRNVILNAADTVRVNMLISELEAFLDNC